MDRFVVVVVALYGLFTVIDGFSLFHHGVPQGGAASKPRVSHQCTVRGLRVYVRTNSNYQSTPYLYGFRYNPFCQRLARKSGYYTWTYIWNPDMIERSVCGSKVPQGFAVKIIVPSTNMRLSDFSYSIVCESLNKEDGGINTGNPTGRTDSTISRSTTISTTSPTSSTRTSTSAPVEKTTTKDMRPVQTSTTRSPNKIPSTTRSPNNITSTSGTNQRTPTTRLSNEGTTTRTTSQRTSTTRTPNERTTARTPTTRTPIMSSTTRYTNQRTTNERTSATRTTLERISTTRTPFKTSPKKKKVPTATLR